MAYRFESGHRHQKEETPPKWVVFFFFMLETDSNPFKCPMPVAWGSHQFKNWWQPYDLPPKGQIGHRVRSPILPKPASLMRSAFFDTCPDSNPSKCPMPVAWGGHQFKNWWHLYDLPPGQIGHRVRSPILPKPASLMRSAFFDTCPDSNPSKCPMPVAWGSHQFKNWWHLYDLPQGKSAIESVTGPIGTMSFRCDRRASPAPWLPLWGSWRAISEPERAFAVANLENVP